MKRGTFNYIKQILKDYPKLDSYIKERKEELRFPHRSEDVNSGIKGNYKSNNQNADMLITLEEDQRLYILERNKRVISENLKQCDKDTYTIINELYIKRYPIYTMEGLVNSMKLSCGKTKAFELRDRFFENIADDLSLDK